MMKSDSLVRSELSSIKTAVFGLAGVSVALLLTILGDNPFDLAMRIALYCFVISLPLLIGLGLQLDIASHRSDPYIPIEAALATMLLWVGPLFTAVGLTSYLWHYEIAAALSFLGASLAAAVMLGLFQRQLIQADSELAVVPHSPSSTLPANDN